MMNASSYKLVQQNTGTENKKSEHILLKEQDSASSIPPEEPRFCTKTSWLQLGYGLWANLTLIGIGLNYGFPAVTMPQLREPESSIKVTVSDEAWIELTVVFLVSVLTLSCPVGSIISGVLTDRYGRRPMLVLCQLPMCVGWFYIGFASNAKDIIVGRLIAGVGIGMATNACRVYITEITLPNMRGLIGALPSLFISVGLTVQAGLGSIIDWKTMCYVYGSFSMIMSVANTFLPDTPYFEILRGSLSQAKINLSKFRAASFDVDSEIKVLSEFRDENDIHRLSLKEQIKAMFKPSSCKPFGISSAYITIMQLAGVNVVIMWAVEMLQLAKSSLDAHMGNIMLALTRIVFGIITSVLIYKVRRRKMALVSAIGVGVVALGLCLFLYLNEERSIFPQFLLMAYIAFATLGYYTLPMIMMFEMLPLQLRGILSGICISELNILMFAMNNSYPFMLEAFGLANTIGTYGAISLLGSVVLFFILPETKGLTLQEIEEYFNSRRPTLVSQNRVMIDQMGNATKKRTKTEKKRDLKQKTSINKIKTYEKNKSLKFSEETMRSKAGYSKDNSHDDNETTPKEKDSTDKEMDSEGKELKDNNYITSTDSKSSKYADEDTSSREADSKDKKIYSNDKGSKDKSKNHSEADSKDKANDSNDKSSKDKSMNHSVADSKGKENDSNDKGSKDKSKNHSEADSKDKENDSNDKGSKDKSMNHSEENSKDKEK